MGLFELFASNTPTNRFKTKFVDALNFLSTYSFGELTMSDSTAKLKIIANFGELKDIARGMNDPLNEYFNFYLTVAGTRLSVGAALIFMQNSVDIAFAGNRISKGATSTILTNAISETNNYHSARLKVSTIINN